MEEPFRGYALSQQLSHEQRERWMLGRCFSVGELAVRGDQRRRGIGERLMRGVVHNCAPERLTDESPSGVLTEVDDQIARAPEIGGLGSPIRLERTVQ